MIVVIFATGMVFARLAEKLGGREAFSTTIKFSYPNGSCVLLQRK